MATHDPNAHYVITKDTPYYTTSPMQGRPAEGKLKAGTHVILLQIQIGGYVKVQTEDETVTGFVASDDVDSLE